MLTSTPRIRFAPTTGIMASSLPSGRSGEDSGVEPPLLPARLLPADGDDPRDSGDGDVACESAEFEAGNNNNKNNNNSSSRIKNY